MAVSLSNIARGRRLKPPKIGMYGPGGIGKTTFGSCAPNPIFLMTEEGQGALDIARYEPRENDPVLRTWQELLDCVASLYTEEHDFQTVVIDTVDFAEPLLWRHTAQKHGVADIEAFGYGKGYGYALDEFRTLARGLDALRDEKGMIIILLAHCEVKKFESPDSAGYDRWKLKLQDKLGGFVHDWLDALLFVNYRAHTVTEEKGFNKKRTRGVGQGERVIYTEARPAWQAKNRYSLPPEIVLPAVEDNPWMAFQNAVAQAASAIVPSASEEGQEG